MEGVTDVLSVLTGRSYEEAMALPQKSGFRLGGGQYRNAVASGRSRHTIFLAKFRASRTTRRYRLGGGQYRNFNGCHGMTLPTSQIPVKRFQSSQHS